MMLTVQTPLESVVQCDVLGVTAENSTGRFGLRSGCEPVLASLIPGVVTYRDLEGCEHYVAVSSGILEADSANVVIAVREAIQSNSLKDVHAELVSAEERRASGEQSLRELLGVMINQMLKRLIEEERYI